MFDRIDELEVELSGDLDLTGVVDCGWYCGATRASKVRACGVCTDIAELRMVQQVGRIPPNLQVFVVNIGLACTFPKCLKTYTFSA